MPIYMDRHFIEDAKRSAIADAHEKDLQIQDKHHVKFLTYWFDEARCSAFCLVDAPNKAAIQSAHDEAHGSVPHEIIEVDPGVVQAFLGRVEDPVPINTSSEPEIDSAFRVIMFTDLKDSTLMTTLHGDTRALHLLHVHNALTRNELREHDGHEVKHTGDGIMASFSSVPKSVECAVSIQKAFDSHNEENPEDGLFLRIGLSAGEPIEEHGDLFGTSVQLAARLCSHAEPGQVLIAENVRELYGDGPVAFESQGGVTPKGFEQAVQIYSAIC
ncbi:nickel-binding protein [Solemya elarraichensis gill symbiont]|uniref:Guanylate cyclase domain-containing protein n=1 Tax=Solemya elarraichensis gill symbiont TaxID=1918949 RepID=A0A1T2L5I6_9GAMM|nr:nickel-binding protein [Solemya elarraichensis gill symbiont]OOZ40349.1 hypothetical protein BOW52_06005 [Solemya elarraichensis gill symbiont]